MSSPVVPDDAGPCPCGRTGTFGPASYAACCGRYLADRATPAPDAESLMRSRYTAYVLRDTGYLRATWDAATRPARLDLDDDVTWLGLEVREHVPAGDTAQVAFVATYRGPDGRVRRLVERSRFVRRGGRWSYVDGEVG